MSGALKIHHLGAVENAPPLEQKTLSFPNIICGEFRDGKYFKDGQNRDVKRFV